MKGLIEKLYVFEHKEHHGSCVGIIKGEGIKHYESKDEAFDLISKILKDK